MSLYCWRRCDERGGEFCPQSSLPRRIVDNLELVGGSVVGVVVALGEVGTSSKLRAHQIAGGLNADVLERKDDRRAEIKACVSMHKNADVMLDDIEGLPPTI